MAPVVTLHPARALVLAAALADAARDLTERSHRLALVLAAHDEDLGPAVAVARSATTLAEEAVRLQRVVAQVRAWEAAGALAGRAVLLRGAVTASHHDPVPAHTAARAAAATYRSGGAGALVAVEDRWLHDPVFAATVLALLGPEVLIEQLAAVGAVWSHPADSVERRVPIAAAGVLATLLAVTTRAGAPAVAVDDLVAAADAQGVAPSVAGFLFLEPEAWAPSYLVSLVDRIVVPANRALIAQGTVARPPWFGAAGSGVDGRTMILEAVAAQPAAALAVAAGSDVAALVDARAGLLDGGASVGRLLLAASRPVDEADIARRAPVVTRLIESVVAVHDAGGVPAGVQRHLGPIVAPWIGGLGSTDFTTYGVPHPLPDLTPGVAHRYLVLAMANDQSAAALGSAEVAWARATLAPVGLTTEPPLVKHVADVMRAVADAGREAHRVGLADEDLRASRLREHLDVVMNVLTLPMRTTPAAEASTVVVVAGVNHLASAGLPPTDGERAYLRGLSLAVSADQWAMQYLLAGVLWSGRRHNGLFAPAVGPPVPGQASEPVDRPFVAADGSWRPYAELDATDRAAFEQWLYELDASGAALAHLLNAAGAEYGGSGR